MHQPLTESSSVAKAPSRFSFAALFRKRGVWALGDQAVVSLGNCITGIILAGTLAPDEFGIFALVFGVVLFLNSLHQSLVIYPLSVRGAVSDAANLRRLAGNSLLFTFALALPLSIAVAVVARIEHRLTLFPWVLAAMFFWQLQETVRRGIMAHLRHREAVAGDAISYLGQAAVLWFLASRHMLTLETAFMAIAATSLLAVLLQAFQLRPSVTAGEHVPAMVRDHWSLGRWVLLANLMTLITVQAMPWTLAYYHGNADVAKFAVLAQVMGPSNPIILSLSGLIIPAVAATAARRGTSGAKHIAVKYGLLGAVMLAPYYGAVFLLPEFALRIFTKNNPAYTGLTTPLRLFALAYVIVFPGQILRYLLDGLGRTRCSFIAQCVFSATTLLVSLPLAAIYGLSGAVWGGVVPAAVFVIFSAVLLRKSPSQAASANADTPAILPMTAASMPKGAAA